MIGKQAPCSTPERSEASTGQNASAHRQSRCAEASTAERQSGLQLGAWSRHHPGASLPLAQGHYTVMVASPSNNLTQLSEKRGEDQLDIMVKTRTSTAKVAAASRIPSSIHWRRCS